jgi:hypothetical protein
VQAHCQSRGFFDAGDFGDAGVGQGVGGAQVALEHQRQGGVAAIR